MVTDDREGVGFFLNSPEKLDNPFPDLQYFRERRPIFFYPPLDEWFIFRYDDVESLFADARLSADRMKGFIDAAPPEARTELQKVSHFLETWVLMQDGQTHTRLRSLLNLGFNADAIRGLSGQIQRSSDELLDRVAAQGRMDASGDFAFLLPAYVLSDFLGVHPEDRGRVVQWSVDFVDFFNVIPITAATATRMTESALEMMAYTRALLAERRAQPKNDFLGTLADVQSTQGALPKTRSSAIACSYCWRGTSPSGT
jgi:cytochrome P450